MKIINIGSFNVLVDDEDYEFLTNVYDMSINQHGYVYCKLKEKYKHKRMGFYTGSLHKILVFQDNTNRMINVDHKDGNKLNNQKENLRICTHANNMKNRKPNNKQLGKDTASKYKGVWWNKKLNMWRVQIRSDNKRIGIGCFTNEIAAANAYNYYAKELHKEYAKLNDVEFMEKDEWIKYKSGENKTSKYVGVSLSNNKWVAQIYHNGKNKIIGKFDTEIEAAKAYNEKAIELKGNKAKINKLS
jgi:hypothetical protein